MEKRALCQTAAPEAPQNLAAPFTAWLREQDFKTTERSLDTLATVVACWYGPGSERFRLTYTWSAAPHAESTCRLDVHYPGANYPETLFTAQRAARLKQACRLLLGNVCYANARLRARLPQPVL
jgi:hypothetical protein